MTLAPTQVDYTNPRIWTEFIRDIAPPGEARGDVYLPRRRVEADRIRFEVGKWARPMAPFVALDAESPVLKIDDILSEVWADALFIRVKDRLQESDLRVLREFGQAPVETMQGRMAAQARQRITNRIAMLNEAVDTRIEWTQMNVLQGRLTVTPDVTAWHTTDVAFDITYPVTGVTPGVDWDDHTNADPILDLRTWFKDIYGYKIGRMVCGLDVLWHLALNTKLRQLTYQGAALQGTGISILTPAQVNNALATHFGLTIDTYTYSYSTDTDNGTTITRANNKILPDGVVLFLPDSPVGYTGEVPVPEPYQSNGYGKFTWRRDPNQDQSALDPLKYEAGVGWYGMPVLQYPNRIIVAQVYTP